MEAARKIADMIFTYANTNWRSDNGKPYMEDRRSESANAAISRSLVAIVASHRHPLHRRASIHVLAIPQQMRALAIDAPEPEHAVARPPHRVGCIALRERHDCAAMAMPAAAS